jgi:protein-tyrosine phosphatase
MAEYCLRKTLFNLGIKKIDVFSAGISAMEGMPASYEALELLKAEGMDASMHKARRLDAELAGYSDHIFVMTAAHETAIKGAFPKAGPKVIMMNKKGISDPIGGGIEEYKKCFREITDSIKSTVLPKLGVL